MRKGLMGRGMDGEGVDGRDGLRRDDSWVLIETCLQRNPSPPEFALPGKRILLVVCKLGAL